MVPAPTGGSATPCRATGAAEWAGPKAAVGEQTITISMSGDATIALECDWVGANSAEFRWIPATQNTDSTSYTNRRDSVIAYTFDASLNFASANDMVCMLPAVTCASLNDAATQRPTMHTFSGITQIGTMRGTAFHVNSNGVWSAPSAQVTKQFTGTQTVTRSIAVTVNPRSAAPSGLELL
jgi:hypothetical protein